MIGEASDFTLTGIEELAMSISREGSIIKSLDLGSCKLGPAFRNKTQSPIYVLMEGLRKSGGNHRLVSLNLSNNDMSTLEADCIIAAIRCEKMVFRNVKELNLGDNPNFFYAHDTASDFCNALKTSGKGELKLERLVLNNTGVENKEKCKLFSNIVNSCENLKTLVLSKNKLTDVGARFLYVALRENTNLKELDLSECALTHSFCLNDSAHLLVKNRTLEVLNLSKNEDYFSNGGDHFAGRAVEGHEIAETMGMALMNLVDEEGDEMEGSDDDDKCASSGYGGGSNIATEDEQVNLILGKGLREFSEIPLSRWYRTEEEGGNVNIEKVEIARFATNDFVIFVDIGGGDERTVETNLFGPDGLHVKWSGNTVVFDNEKKGEDNSFGMKNDEDEYFWGEMVKWEAGNDDKTKTRFVGDFPKSEKELIKGETEIARIEGALGAEGIGRIVLRSPSDGRFAQPVVTHALGIDSDPRNLRVCSGIGSVGAKIVGKLLLNSRSCQFLRCLDISNNKISANGVNALISSMLGFTMSNAILQELNVSHNMLGRDGGLTFADFIRRHKFVETLNLSFNNLDGVAAEEIGKALEVNKTITSLNLSGNKKVNEEERRSRSEAGGSDRRETLFFGLTELLKSLKKNKTIRFLDLSDRTCLNMKREQATLCAEFLADKSCELVELNLSSNQLNSETNVLFGALKANKR